MTTYGAGGMLVKWKALPLDVVAHWCILAVTTARWKPHAPPRMVAAFSKKKRLLANMVSTPLHMIRKAIKLASIPCNA